jgi:tetratricopeptide (TPR) repeat protein
LTILTIVLLMGCARSRADDGAIAIDLTPMYGAVEKSPRQQQEDAKFIRKAIAEFGSRQVASAAIAQEAWQRYREDDPRGAMMRFNQVWLLEPASPQSYWGFGVILHERGKVDDALSMLTRAFEIDPSSPRLMADIAWVTGSKAVQTTNDAERSELFSRANELFATATTRDRSNGYLFDLWAITLYDQGRYLEAWEKVHEAQALCSPPPEKFLRMLRDKFPEPRTRP